MIQQQEPMPESIKQLIQAARRVRDDETARMWIMRHTGDESWYHDIMRRVRLIGGMVLCQYRHSGGLTIHEQYDIDSELSAIIVQAPGFMVQYNPEEEQETIKPGADRNIVKKYGRTEHNTMRSYYAIRD